MPCAGFYPPLRSESKCPPLDFAKQGHARIFDQYCRPPQLARGRYLDRSHQRNRRRRAAARHRADLVLALAGTARGRCNAAGMRWLNIRAWSPCAAAAVAWSKPWKRSFVGCCWSALTPVGFYPIARDRPITYLHCRKRWQMSCHQN